MIRVTLVMKVKEEKENEFIQAWRSIAQYTQQVQGNMRQTLLQDSDAPTTFIIVSDWESHEDFSRFEKSHEQDVLTAPLRALRQTSSMTIHPIVVHLEKES